VELQSKTLISVRRATPSHAPAIRAIADAAWRVTYQDMLRPETIDWFLERAYSEERVALRIERHVTWVADLADEVAAFAESAIEPDRVTLVAIYADPDRRGLELDSALLRAITSAHPDLPSPPTSWSAIRPPSRSMRRAASHPRSTSTRSWAASTSASAAGGCGR
jgi:ribosomal protein S18 acetylase RimI-like enzyme